MSSRSPSESGLAQEARHVDENLLQRYALDATDAILKLWDESRGTFWRSTMHRNVEAKTAAPDVFFPTVSLRCLDALLSLIVDFPDWTSADIRKAVLEEVVSSIITHSHNDLDTSLNIEVDGEQGLNLFTLSLYVQAFSRISSLNALPRDRDTAALAKLDAAAKALVGHATFTESDEDKSLTIHPFLLYHSCRAMSSFLALQRTTTPDACRHLVERIKASVRDSIRSLIAKQRLASLNPGDSVAAAFCAATLALALTDDDWQYTRASIELCFHAQDANGCWPLGRIVREDKTLVNEKLEISTYEIAAIVAETLGRLADEANERLATGLGADSVGRVIQAGRYTERSAVRIAADAPPNVGWCTDPAYGEDVIQSWTCATVLQSLLNLARLIEESDRQTILATFAHASPSDADWPSWRRWKVYRVDGEVDHKHRVVDYLHKKLVEPVLASPRRLPNRNPSSVSVLLFGPPGTSKTTIVKAVADGLQWPVVLLSPGDFIERGLEYIEAQARSVFERLMTLSRAVVIFDECDELFRDRAPSADTEQTRGITAFVTASMLPKLQELHDRGRVIFFICTNNFGTIDPAIKRGGRIDHIIGIGPPDEAARLKIADVTVRELQSGGWTPPAHFDAAKKRLVVKTERFTRSEIQRAVRLLARGKWDSESAAESQADGIAKTLTESLTISERDYSNFVRFNNQFSHPLKQGESSHA